MTRQRPAATRVANRYWPNRDQLSYPGEVAGAHQPGEIGAVGVAVRQRGPNGSQKSGADSCSTARRPGD